MARSIPATPSAHATVELTASGRSARLRQSQGSSIAKYPHRKGAGETHV
jgi:hypothetical protein